MVIVGLPIIVSCWYVVAVLPDWSVAVIDRLWTPVSLTDGVQVNVSPLKLPLVADEPLSESAILYVTAPEYPDGLMTMVICDPGATVPAGDSDCIESEPVFASANTGVLKSASATSMCLVFMFLTYTVPPFV
jgi:hypothetical protein